MRLPAILSRLLPGAGGAKEAAFGSAYFANLARLAFGTSPSKSGADVNVETALRVSTVLACARVISEGMAQVPLKLFRKTGDNILPAVEHPLYDKLHRRPNPWSTSFELRETMGLHAVLCGNAYAFINRAGGRVAELVPVDPGIVTPRRSADMTISYDIRGTSGEVRNFPAAAIWHLRGPSWNGWVGMEALSLAREAIGLAMVTEESQARLHQRGLRPSGMYSVEGTLTEAQYKALASWLEAEYGGAANAAKPMVLDRNAKWHPFSLSGVDAQHLETRRHQVAEICAAFRVLPIMIGYSDKAATFASAEQMFLAHVIHTLGPWFERFEQSADAALLTDEERRNGYYVKHIVAGLLRGAMKDTAEYLHKLVLDGVMTRNEARALLELNPLDGLSVPLTPANMIAGAAAPADA